MSQVSPAVAIMPRTKYVVHIARLHIIMCVFHKASTLLVPTAPTLSGFLDDNHPHHGSCSLHALCVSCLGHKAHHKLHGINSRHLTALEVGSPRLRWWQIQFLVGGLFLTCRWPPSLHVLTWPFLFMLQEEALSLFVKGHRSYWNKAPPV